MIWHEFEAATPRLAGLGRERFARHHVALIGTLRADGSPRISPVEPYLVLGHLLLGFEWPTSKARDLLRDPRCTLHSTVTDPDGQVGEFKLFGRALAADPVLANGDHPAWWHGRQPAGYRVFWMRSPARKPRSRWRATAAMSGRSTSTSRRPCSGCRSTRSWPTHCRQRAARHC